MQPKLTGRDFPSVLSNFLAPENWYENGMFQHYNPFNIPAVNIFESTGEYSIEIAVPGLKKKNFKIILENSTLSVSVERDDAGYVRDEHCTKLEYSFEHFSRSFSLPSTVIKKISMWSYRDGILKIILPKMMSHHYHGRKEIIID